MKHIFTIIFFYSLSVDFSFAQTTTNNIKTETELPVRKCVIKKVDLEFEAWIQDKINKDGAFSNAKIQTTAYNIPVVYHILHSGQAIGTSYNISAAQINSQTAILNADFSKTNATFSTYVTQPSFIAAAADCQINFCPAEIDPNGNVMLEPGIDRINVTTKGWTSPPSYSGMNDSYIENTIKPGSIWDPTKYFNIWVFAFNDGVLGYAQFPTVPSVSTPTIGDAFGEGGSSNTDGVCIDYRCIGNTGNSYPQHLTYNLGRTASHEIGHWLGLYHIWGDESGCSGTDYVNDTPNQAGPRTTCPTTDGIVITDACSPNSPGVMYQNYMDYGDDRCLNLFTTGQKSRMHAVMQYCVNRTSLATSTVCNIPNSVFENIPSIQMSIYPNPSKGELTISIDILNTQDYRVIIINPLGQTIKEINQIKSHGGIHKIDLSDKSSGIYFVTVKSLSGSVTKRILLQ